MYPGCLEQKSGDSNTLMVTNMDDWKTLTIFKSGKTKTKKDLVVVSYEKGFGEVIESWLEDNVEPGKKLGVDGIGGVGFVVSNVHIGEIDNFLVRVV